SRCPRYARHIECHAECVSGFSAAPPFVRQKVFCASPHHRAPASRKRAQPHVKIQQRNYLCDLHHSLWRPASPAFKHLNSPSSKGGRMPARTRKIGVALWILLVTSLVL